jgi:hypothetical protein
VKADRPEKDKAAWPHWAWMLPIRVFFKFFPKKQLKSTMREPADAPIVIDR